MPVAITARRQLKLSGYLWKWYAEKKKHYEELKDQENASDEISSTKKRYKEPWLHSCFDIPPGHP